MKFTHFLESVAVVGVVLLMSGCSFAASQKQAFSVITIPEDASVYVNGRKVRSGQQVEFSRGRDLSVAVSAPGYYSEQRSVGRILSKHGMIDGVAGCFLFVPWIGLISDGAWAFEADSIHLELQKK